MNVQRLKDIYDKAQAEGKNGLSVVRGEIYKKTRQKPKRTEIREMLGIPFDYGAIASREANREAWATVGYAKSRIRR